MLKMRAYIFTPGDLICRRGEVAREMFIIADGVVEIIGYVQFRNYRNAHRSLIRLYIAGLLA